MHFEAEAEVVAEAGYQFVHPVRLSAGSTSFRSQPFSTCLNGQLQQQHTHTLTHTKLRRGRGTIQVQKLLNICGFLPAAFVVPIHFSYRVFKFYYCMCHKRRLVGVLDL